MAALRAVMTVTVSCCLFSACGMQAEPPSLVLSEPVEADVLRFVEVTTGDSHSCARAAHGTVYCWGRNLRGQLGDGTRIDRGSPTRVSGIANAVSLSAGVDRTCVARADGTVWCWGSTHEYWEREYVDGWLYVDDVVPVAIEGIVGATEVRTLHDGVCARTEEGPWSCLGEELTEAACRIEREGVVCVARRCSGWGCPAPGDHLIDATEGATVVEGTLRAGCAVVDREARCWGEIPGRLDQERSTEGAVAIEGTTGAVDLALPWFYPMHACALHEDGHVSCWGFDTYGQLGFGTQRVVSEPRRVSGLTGIVALVAGNSHTCALDIEQRAWCWGSNWSFQIGSGLLGHTVTRPLQMWFAPVQHIEAGHSGTCVVADGELWCTGTTGWDYLDVETGVELYGRPWRTFDLPEAVALTGMVRWWHGDWGWPGHGACAVAQSGRVLCPAGSWSERWTEEEVSLLGSDRLLLDGNQYRCGRIDGRWRCAGERGPDDLLDPRVTDLAIYGREPACLVIDGQVKCNGLGPEFDEIESVVGVTDAVGIERVEHRVCAVRADGRLLCWGRGVDGTLGSQEPTEREDAVLIGGLPPVVDVAMGWHHTCALSIDRDVWCWGYRATIGDGAPIRFAAARPVSF